MNEDELMRLVCYPDDVYMNLLDLDIRFYDNQRKIDNVIMNKIDKYENAYVANIDTFEKIIGKLKNMKKIRYKFSQS